MKADDSLFDAGVDELERLPVGVVTLDRAGRILQYNRAESALSGMAAADVVGRRFFGDVAPCTAVREFEGRFLAFAAEKTTATEQFDFPFQFAWGVQNVKIAMLRRAGRPEIQLVVRTVLSADEEAGAPMRTVDEPLDEPLDEAYDFDVPWWSIDPVDGTARWSDDLRALLGASAAFRPDADSLVARVHPSERAVVRHAIAQSAERRRPFAVQSRTLGFDGRIRSVVFAGGTYGAGDATFVAGTAIEISDQRLGLPHVVRERMAAVSAALADNRIVVDLQPIVDARTSETIGCEALARIRRRDGTFIMPTDFIADCETSGLIVPLGKRVLEIVAATMRTWSGTPLETARVSINVSPKQLDDARFVPFLRDLLATANIAPDRIVLDLTSRLPERFDALLDALVSVKLLGVRIAIDDFGTGYSALAFLKFLPIDTLKLDRPFVAGLGLHPLDEAIASTIIALGNDLRIDVVAEGVETAAQRDYLMSRGISIMQGYLFGPAVASDAFATNTADFDT